MDIRRILPAAILAFGIASPAVATTLASPSLDVGDGDQLVCRVVNLGPKHVTVTAKAVDGTTGALVQETDLELDPGKADVIAVPGQITGYCRFDGAFSKTTVRASLDVFSDATQRTILIVPAQ